MHDLDRLARAMLKTYYKTSVKSSFLQKPTPWTYRIWTSVSQTCPDVPTGPPLRYNECLRLTLKSNVKTYAKPSSHNRRDVKATAGKKFIRMSHYDSSYFSQSLSAFSLARRNARSRLNKERQQERKKGRKQERANERTKERKKERKTHR